MGGERWIDEVKIRYHHWSITGFKPVLKNKSAFNPGNLDKLQMAAYEQYKSRRHEVLALEKHLISETKSKIDERCWNKAVSRGSTCPDEFTVLAREVLGIVV